MWSYRSQIGMPLDPLFLSLGHATLPYPHQLLKDECLGGFIAPFNLSPLQPSMLFAAFNLWHSSHGVNLEGVHHSKVSLLTSGEDRLAMANRLLVNALHDRPILVGDSVASEQGFLVVMASSGYYNHRRKRWQMRLALSDKQRLPKANQLTLQDYSYQQAIYVALGQSIQTDSALNDGQTTLASTIQELAQATKNYLDNLTSYLASATAGAGTAGTTLIPPISSMSTLWDSTWQADIQQIKDHSDQAKTANDEALEEYQEAIDAVASQEPKGYQQGLPL